MPKFDREIMIIDKLHREHDIGKKQEKSYQSPDLVEGYWADSTHADLPKPIPNHSPWDGQDSWLKSLDIVEKKIKPHGQHSPKKNGAAEGVSEYKYFTYGDHSPCRLCDKKDNGISEYQIKIGGAWYRWPDGLRHYVIQHNVTPSRQFYDLIIVLSANVNW